jgi:putative transposase
MRTSKYSEEQVIGILKEHNAGLPTAEICRKYGVSGRDLRKRPAVAAGWRALGRSDGSVTIS